MNQGGRIVSKQIVWYAPRIAWILLAWYIPAYAGSITLINASFDLPPGSVPCNASPPLYPSNCYFSSAAPEGWTSNSSAGYAGTFQPGDASTVAFLTYNDGPSSAFINGPGNVAGGGNAAGGKLTQTVGTAVLGMYTLMVNLGFRNDDQYFASEADLMIGSHTIAAAGSTPAQGGWSTFTAKFEVTAADVGKQIAIQLLNTGVAGGASGQANFDDVRLNGPIDVPEPGSTVMALMGAAMLALGSLTKRARMRREN
jgi:hypothetical protein